MQVKLVAVLLVVVMAAGVGVVIGVAAGGGDGPENLPMPPNIIVVAGSGSVSTAPDKATVSLGANTQAGTADEALKENAVRIDAVLKALKSAGVEDNDIQTQNMSVNKHYQDRGTAHETISYVATQELSVVIHDVTKVGDIIDSAVQAGANDVGGIEFGLSEAATAKDAALKDAVENAQVKAEALASGASAAIGPVVRIDENNYDVQNSYARYDQALMAMPSAAGTTISPGEVQTEVQVRVTFELKPAEG